MYLTYSVCSLIGLDFATGEQHACPRHGRWAWVPCLPSAPQLLLLSEGHTMRLVQAPHLVETHSQEVSFEAWSCSCAHNAAAFQDSGNVDRLLVYRLIPEPAAGHAFLEPLCVLPHSLTALAPVFSPSGEHFVRLVRLEGRSTFRLDIASLASAQPQIVGSVQVSSFDWEGEFLPRWSADGCSISIRSVTSSLHLIRLLAS